MKKRFISILMALLVIFHGACAGTPIHTITTPPVDSGTFVPVEVVLQGLEIPDSSIGLQETSLLLAPGANGEAIVPLNRGNQAPYNGVLLNGPAVARVSVEFHAQQQRYAIDRDHNIALVVARYNADIASLQLALSTQQRADQVILNGRDEDLARLNRLLSTQQNPGPHIVEGLIWAGSGFLVGVILVGGIVIAANARP